MGVQTLTELDRIAAELGRLRRAADAAKAPLLALLIALAIAEAENAALAGDSD